MKKITFFILFTLVGMFGFSQTFPGTGTPVDTQNGSGNTDATCGTAFELDLTVDVTGIGVLGSANILDQVDIDITHTWAGDVNVTLIAPDGTTSAVLTAGNGGSGDNYTGTEFRDDAATSIVGGTAPFTGPFQPEEALSTFNGVDADGTWTLNFCDSAGGDTGTFNSWALTFAPAPSCLAPSGLTGTVLTATTAELSWTAGGGETLWDVEIVDITGGGSATGTPTDTGVSNPYMAMGLTEGNDYEYYVRADCGGANGVSDWVGPFAWSQVVPPSNDECANAIALTVNSDLACGTVTNGTIEAATNSGVDACGGTEDDDVWFSFVATSTEHEISLINITGGTTDLYHAVYDATPGCGSLGAALTCSDPNTSTTTGLTIGNTYFVQVYSWTGTANQTSVFDICVGTPPPPPANDDCANAEALTINTDGTCTITTSGTLVSSTESNVDPSCDTGTEWDVWYSFVAPASGNIDFTVTLGTGNPLEYAVFDDCAGTTELFCSDPLDGASLTGLTPGTTYYLMVWNDGFETPGDFTICASEPTCTPSTAAYTVVNDCDVSGGFLIDVEITDLGTATALTISNDQDATSFPVTAAGTTVQFGPFTNGTDVIITVSDDNNATCDYSSSALTQTACPPANDDCSGAQAITQETDIADAASATAIPGTLEAATDSGLPAELCNGFTGTANDDVWYSFEALTSDVTVTVDDVSSFVDLVVVLYSGTCGALVVEGCDDSGNPEEISATGLTVGNTYYFRVFQYGSGSTVGDDITVKVWSSSSLSTVDLENGSSFSYYPNPVKNTLTLNAAINNIDDVVMFNMLGQQVMRVQPNALNSELDMTNMQTGTYFVKVTIADTIQTIRVVKQ